MMRQKPLLPTFLLLLAWCIPAHAAESTQPEAEQMQSWWEDLAKNDPDASRALLKMSAKPEQTIAFLKDKLLPLKIDEDEVNKLIKDLESNDETVWKPADEKLRYYDPRLAIELTVLMANTTNPTARSRLVEILSDREQGAFAGKSIRLHTFAGGDNFVVGNSSFWAERDVSRLGGGFENKRFWTRAIRAIILLEHFGTPDAIAILKEMSTGNPDTQPTKQANTALEDLNVPAK